MEIRPAQPADWPAIAQLLGRASLPLDGAEAHLGHFLVASQEQQVAGVAGLEVYGEHGLLRSVAVDREFRGEGLGGQLTNAIITQARAGGLASLTLLTTTAADYFPRWGFTRIERHQAPTAVTASVEFQGACPASAVVMTLALR